MSEENIPAENEQETPIQPMKSNSAAVFGKKYGMKVMTFGFAIFAVGVFFSVSGQSTPLTKAAAALGFVMYITGRILHAASRRR